MTTEWYRYFFNLYGFTGGGTGAIPTNRGGTGQIIYTDGQLLIGNSTTGSLDKATITGGAGINVTNGPGSIALSLGGSGVTPGNYGNASTVPQLTINEYGIISAATNVAIAISATQIVSGIVDPARISGNYSGITGVGTISSGVWQGTSIGVPYGGTGLSSYILGDMLYATGTTALSKLAIGANTYILASTGTAPQWVAPSTISIGTATNLAGGLANQIPYQTGPGATTFMVAPTVANTYLNWSGSAFQWSSNPLGTVTSVSVVSANGFAGTVATATTTPAITLTTSITGILKGNGTAISAATSGTDYAPATSGTSILYGNGAGGFSNVTIGTGVAFVGGTLSATGTGGTVTNVSGTSPVSVATGTTTPVISLASGYGDTQNPYASKTANYFLAAPNGSAGVPTFRAIVAADIPALSYVTSVSGTGTVNGITLTGIVTSTGSLTLGGTLGGIGNSQLTNSTISGVALGGSLFNLTAGTGVSFNTGTTYNGSAAITINATGLGGDVVGPASATDEAIARFDTTTGKLIQNSSATINDSGQLALNTGAAFGTALLTLRSDAGASTTPSISMDGYGGTVYNIGFRRANGTIASPTATLATTIISILGATTGDGTTYANTSAIQSALEATATPTSQPTALLFAVTPSGSISRGEVLRLRSTGAVAFSGATNYGTSGQVLQSNGNAAPTWTNTPTLTGTNFSAIPNSALSNSTISGVALGGSLFNLTAGTGVSFSTGTTYNGSTAITINATGTGGTVTSVAALTLGTTGTDLSSTVANGTTTPVITLNVPTASAANRGALSSTDWSTFNGKQAALVSGTNIKTVGGVTLLGSGDVGTIGTAYGGTGLTTFTANRIFYASSTSVIAQSAGLTFDGTNFATTGSATATAFIPTSSTVPTNGMYLSSANTLAWATNSTFRMSLDATGTLSTSGALSANTTVTAATSLKANLALGSGAGIDTSGQTGVVVAASSNGLLITGSGYYLVSIAEVTTTGLNGVYVLGNGSVTFLGGIGWVATTTTPGAGTYSIAFSGGNYRIYNGFTPAGTYTFKATVIRMH
jgi:hypothetical protein